MGISLEITMGISLETAMGISLEITMGGIWEASGKHLGGIWEASGRQARGIWGASGGHLESIWEASGIWDGQVKARGGLEGKMCHNHCAFLSNVARPTISPARERPDLHKVS